MKRIASALMMAAAAVGCQSRVGNLNATNYTNAGAGQNVPPAPSGTADYQPVPTNSGIQQVSHQEIIPVGYNKGYGAYQNNNYGHQKVGVAVPSHGGALPGLPGAELPGGIPGFGIGPGGAPPSGPIGGMPPGFGPMGGMPPGGPGFPGPVPGDIALGPRFVTGRTQVRFVGPTDMKIGWQSMDPRAPGGFTPPQLQAPARYNFAQANIYRLKLTDIPNRGNLSLYPTLEIYPGNVKTNAYLAHNAVPVEITDEDLDQVQASNYVTKVIYLPDPKFQELAIAGVETLVSTRLDPGIDPVQEANRRGAILAVLRLGAVDLEMSYSPPLFGYVGPPPGVLMGDGIPTDGVFDGNDGSTFGPGNGTGGSGGSGSGSGNGGYCPPQASAAPDLTPLPTTPTSPTPPARTTSVTKPIADQNVDPFTGAPMTNPGPASPAAVPTASIPSR